MNQRFAVAFAACLAAGAARAETQVSLDVQGFASSSPLEGASMLGNARQAALSSTTGGAMSSGSVPSLGTIIGAELRPSYSFGRGLRFGVGFRVGKSGSLGSLRDESAGPSASLVGGDVALGYQRWIGRFLPYAEVRFGFNSYDIAGASGAVNHADQLRLDAVLGGRVYLGNVFYVAASGFAGWGDQYGGSIGLGCDIVRYRKRGLLP